MFISLFLASSPGFFWIDLLDSNDTRGKFRCFVSGIHFEAMATSSPFFSLAAAASLEDEQDDGGFDGRLDGEIGSHLLGRSAGRSTTKSDAASPSNNPKDNCSVAEAAEINAAVAAKTMTTKPSSRAAGSVTSTGNSISGSSGGNTSSSPLLEHHLDSDDELLAEDDELLLSAGSDEDDQNVSPNKMRTKKTATTNMTSKSALSIDGSPGGGSNKKAGLESTSLSAAAAGTRICRSRSNNNISSASPNSGPAGKTMAAVSTRETGGSIGNWTGNSAGTPLSRPSSSASSSDRTRPYDMPMEGMTPTPPQPSLSLSLSPLEEEGGEEMQDQAMEENGDGAKSGRDGGGEEGGEKMRSGSSVKSSNNMGRGYLPSLDADEGGDTKIMDDHIVVNGSTGASLLSLGGSSNHFKKNGADIDTDTDTDTDTDDNAFWASFGVGSDRGADGIGGGSSRFAKGHLRPRGRTDSGRDDFSSSDDSSSEDDASGNPTGTTSVGKRPKNEASSIKRRGAASSGRTGQKKKVDQDDDVSSVSSSSCSSSSSSSPSSSSSSDSDSDGDGDAKIGKKESTTKKAAATRRRLDVRTRKTKSGDDNFAALTKKSLTSGGTDGIVEVVDSSSSDEEEEEEVLEIPRRIDLEQHSRCSTSTASGHQPNHHGGGRGQEVSVNASSSPAASSNALSSTTFDALVKMMEVEDMQKESMDVGETPGGGANGSSPQNGAKSTTVEAEKSQFSLQVGLSSSVGGSGRGHEKSCDKDAGTGSFDGSSGIGAGSCGGSSVSTTSAMPKNPYQAQLKKAQAKSKAGSNEAKKMDGPTLDGDRDDGTNRERRPAAKPSLQNHPIPHADQHLQQQQQPQEDQSNKRPLVHHSLYKPPPYRPRPEPRVHYLTARSRPPQTRPMLPVNSVFRPPVSHLWRSKFHSFNHLQSEVAQLLVNSDDNVVVSAPTGAGKTAVFEMAMGRLFASDLRGRPAGHGISKSRKVVYISPSKALCEERYEDWSQRLADIDPSLECACVTGDASQDSYRDIASAHVIVTTPEKWDGITRRWTDHVFLIGSVKLLLIDEVHLLGDDTRGCTLEAVICRMKTIQRATKAKANLSSSDMQQRATYANTTEEALKADMRIVTVSATLPNIADIAVFVEANEAYAFDSSYRPVPLTVHVSGQGYAGRNQYLFDQRMCQQVPSILREFSDGRPSIVFCHSKRDTEKLATDLSSSYGSSPQVNPQLRNIANQTRLASLQRCLFRGVAYHHAGMDAQDRRLVEHAFSNGMISALCATSTLAMGVNLPAHLVVIKGTSMWRGAGIGHVDIDPGTLLQMMGRAGRPGFDTSGTAVIMTDNKSKKRYEQLSMGMETVESRLLGRLVETINTEISQKVITDASQALDWVKGTFFFSRIKKNPVFYGMQGKTEQQQNSYLQNKCLTSLEELHRAKIIELHSGGIKIKPLPGSHVMSRNMVDFEAMKSMIALPHDSGPLQLLHMLSNIEGLQRPIRRAEKKILNDAHKQIKHKLEGAPSKVRVQTPAEKAFVLLQCSIGQIYLDDSTLRQEMNHMAEYAGRMIGACEQYSVNGSHNGQVALESLLLGRSLATSLWGAGDGVLNQIPGVGQKVVARLAMAGIRNFADVLGKTSNQIEQGCGKRSPFGQDVKVAVQKILDNSLSVSARIEGLNDPSRPTTLVCNVDELKPECRGADRSAHVLSYTLLVHTDRPGGLLMNRERICEAGEHRITCPDRFGRIYIRLVASLVGLDARLELDGNDDIVCSSFNLSPKRAKEAKSNAKGKGKGKTKSKSKPSTTTKGSDTSGTVAAGSTRSKPKSQKEEAEKKLLRDLVKDVDDHRMRTSRKDPAKSSTGRRPLPTKRDECIDLCEEEGDSVPNASTSTVSPSPPPPSRTTSTPHYTYQQQQQSNGKSTGKRGANVMAAASAAEGDGRVGGSGGNKFMNWREQKRRREETAAGGGRNLAPNAHNIRGPSRGSGPSIGCNSGTIAAPAVNKGSNSSWRYERKEQAAMQKRAFGSPKENPFSSFQFDPNCAESNLDALSGSRSSSTANTDNVTIRDSNNGFIPPSFGRAAAAGGRMTGRRFSTAKKKSRSRANGLTLPPTELLRNKANEMAALQGHMQYQATATSTGMGMSTGPGSGPHSQYESLGQQVQGGGTSILPSFLQHPHPQQQQYPYQQQQVAAMAQGMAQARPMTSFAPMPMPPMQQVQVPVAAAMMPAIASGPTMAATSPFGYNPMGPGYGHYHQTMGGVGMDGSVASHSYTSSPPPPFAGRQPQAWEEGQGICEQNLGDGYGAFGGEDRHVDDYVDAFDNGDGSFGGEDINIEPNDAIPTVIETRHLPMVPDSTQEQVPVANPYAKPSADAGCGEGGHGSYSMYQSSYAQLGNVGAPDDGNPYAATASAGEAVTSNQSFDDAFF